MITNVHTFTGSVRGSESAEKESNAVTVQSTSTVTKKETKTEQTQTDKKYVSTANVLTAAELIGVGGKPSCNVSICLHTLMIKNLLFMTLKFQKAGKSWFCRGTTETRNSNQRYSNNLFIYRYYACYNFLGCLMMMMMMMITGALKKKGKESPTGQKGSVGFSKMTPLDEEAEEETSKSASKKVKVKTGPTVSVKQ